MTRICGIDPGVSSGALAVIDASPDSAPRFVAVADVPSIGEGAKKRVDVIAVMKFIQKYEPSHGFVERAQSLPKQGSSSGFLYGRAVGALETCVIGLLIPHTFVEASGWKRALGLIGQDKEGSRQRALALFPEAHSFLARKKDHDRAESILIAYFGWLLLRSDGKKIA